MERYKKIYKMVEKSSMEDVIVERKTYHDFTKKYKISQNEDLSYLFDERFIFISQEHGKYVKLGLDESEFFTFSFFKQNKNNSETINDLTKDQLKLYNEIYNFIKKNEYKKGK